MTQLTLRPWVLFVVGMMRIVALGAAQESSDDVSNSENAEAHRLVRHFELVETTLRARDVSHLSWEQREARREHLDRLAGYRLAQRFPHHHGEQHNRTPYFVDVHGSLCAMAYLISESGHADLVELVWRRANTASVLELAADSMLGPRLEGWLVEAGLTLAEAQWIQPAYQQQPVEPELNAYAIGSIGVGLVNVVTAGLGVVEGPTNSSRSWLHGVGMMTGFAGIGLGAGRAIDDRTDVVAVANFVLGMASFAINAASIGHLESPESSEPFRRQTITVRPEIHLLEGGRTGYGLSLVF